MRDDQGGGTGQRPGESDSELTPPGQEQYASREPGEPDRLRDSDQPSQHPQPGEYGQQHETSSIVPGFGNPDPAQPSFGHWSFATDQPGQPSEPGQPGDPATGEPAYAPPGGPGYGQPPYGQPPYGQPPFGHPGLSQTAPFGHAGAYGQPGYLPAPSTAARRRRSFLTYLIVAIVAAAAGAGLTAYFVGNGGSSNASSPQAGGGNGGTGGNNGGFPNIPGLPSGNSGGNSGTGVSDATQRAVIKAVRPGLVDISSNLQYQGSQAAATGMVISSNGLVLTNNHVIADTTQLYATVVATHQRFTARWLGYDASDDVAVIKLIGAHNLRTVPLGDSSKVKVGDGVVAMGNADGAGGVTPAAGTITGLNRTIRASDSGQATTETLRGMLQTNAGIVQGDSGGALADTAGRVIGMNTAAATGIGSPNVGFAIPINKALAIASKIIHGQSSNKIQIGSTGFMGVLVPAGQASLASNPQVQRQRQLQQDESNSSFPVNPATPECLPNDLTAGVPGNVAPVSSGALIIGELCGTPANRAGIVPGDVITTVGQHKVTSPAQLTKVMLTFKPGDTVQVTWVDVHGQTHRSALTLIQAPPH